MPSPYRYVRACAWGGPLVLVALIVFWAIMGYNIPPYSASLPAEAIADHFRQHTTEVRVGMLLTMAFSPLYLVWGLAITTVMEKIETDNHILSRLQLWGAGFTTIVVALPACIWLTAAFRPDELDPEITRLLYDFGWLFFDCAFALTMLQMIPMGVCFLSDKRAQPLIPHWASWYIIWVGCMLPLLGLIALFKSGPFERAGLINFWIEFNIFFLFMIIASIFVLRAIPRLEQEHATRADG